MRQIKFRGKRFDSGEWIYGSFFTGFTGICYILILHDHILGITKYHEVIPETVGQFTGLLDKNGKEVYEGDLLVWNDDKQAMYEVFYNDDEAKYDCCRVHYMGNRCGGSIPYITNKCLEIIGNIHGNPELLNKGEAK